MILSEPTTNYLDASISFKISHDTLIELDIIVLEKD
jgi:hypothetical protein